jgi:hypothetical protein
MFVNIRNLWKNALRPLFYEFSILVKKFFCEKKNFIQIYEWKNSYTSIFMFDL